MTLSPIWRTRLYATGGSLLAVWLGFSVAQQELFWPILVLVAVTGLLLIRLQPLPVTSVLLGLALAGYIVGNRGFAQLYVTNSLPLLPAEIVLLVGCVILGVQSAFRRKQPFPRDALNLGLLVWMIVCGSRLLFDLRAHGFIALRDFATVYYAVFFFLAQDAVQAPVGRRFLTTCLLASCAILPLTNFLADQFPGFFLTMLTVRDTPLIYYKGDLIGTFMAVGAVLFFLRYEERRQWWLVAMSLILIAATVATNNRASMLGIATATFLLVLGGRWRFAAVQTVAGTVALVVLAVVTYFGRTTWEESRLHSLYDQVVSISDPWGRRDYSSADAFNKGDNNLFRFVWWRAVVDETSQTNPYLGMGFGYDLAARFVQEYQPEATEEFSVRSPHNILLTLFGRTGLLGLIPFLIVVGVMAQRTLRAVRHESPGNAGLWCGSWAILVSACFGVVLEGPMGAMVFWTMLGMASGASMQDNAEKATEGAAAALQPAEQAGEVAAAP